jgi:hypothetical protein
MTISGVASAERDYNGRFSKFRVRIKNSFRLGLFQLKLLL